MPSSRTYTTQAASYWEHQRPIGELGGELNRWKFEPYIKAGDVVVDFGCGGGYLLAKLPGREKIGVEPSPLARGEAERRGLRVVADATDLSEESADVVISSHTLEHTLAPLEELRMLKRALRPGGKMILVVPINDWRSERKPNRSDPDRHLYTWTPLLLGNLLLEAGFEVERAEVVGRAWHPRVTPTLKRLLPARLEVASQRLLSLFLRRREVHAIASRPSH